MYSVIVPIYKVEKYLPQCIESILAQTYRDFELILVDDGSPDDCPVICDEYAKKDFRIKVIHKNNGGLVSARRSGLEAAKGDYICFVDGDDFISCDMLDSYEKIISQKKADIICTGFSRFYDNNNVITVLQKKTQEYYEKSDIISQIYPKMLSTKPFFNFYIFPSIWSKCFKRELLRSVYKYIPDNISLGEDTAVVYSALLRAKSLYIIDYHGYMYRQNLSSMTHTYDQYLYEKIRTLMIYLKNLEASTGWQAGNQINEYAVFLLILAKDNEFKYNPSNSYYRKKKNIKKYLNDPVFKEALKKVKIEGLAYKFILYCFKARFFMPLYLYEKIIKR